MTRDEIYADMRETLGLVPTMFTNMPDSSLETEWQLFKTIEMSEGPIPPKYRELIGLGIAAATHCQYCTLHHTLLAQLHGATAEEIEGALRFAKHTSGWSTYVNGEAFDFDEFKKEHLKMVEYLKEHKPQAVHA